MWLIFALTPKQFSFILKVEYEHLNIWNVYHNIFNNKEYNLSELL